MKKLLYLSVLIIATGALVTFFLGDSGQVHLRRLAVVSSYLRDDGSAASLPFSIVLKEFRVEHYPGSDMPRDYVSEVTVLPSGRERTISMNHILKYKGYRLFQADYDPDLEGSVLTVSHDPWGTGIVYTGYILILVAMLGLMVQRFRGMNVAVPKYIWILGIVLLAGLFFYICRRLLFQPLMPVLRSPLLWIHVVSVIISYSVFALGAICGVWGLVSGEAGNKLMNVSELALYPASFMLAFGIIIGSVWANISWGNYWSWDPKETWALITLLVYSVPLGGLRVFNNPKVFHTYAILAFVSVLITYFGVNFFLGGMHAYA